MTRFRTMKPVIYKDKAVSHGKSYHVIGFPVIAEIEEASGKYLVYGILTSLAQDESAIRMYSLCKRDISSEADAQNSDMVRSFKDYVKYPSDRAKCRLIQFDGWQDGYRSNGISVLTWQEVAEIAGDWYYRTPGC